MLAKWKRILFICQMIIIVLWFVYWFNQCADSSLLSYEWLSAFTESIGALVSAVYGPNRASVYGSLCVAVVRVPFLQHSCTCVEANRFETSVTTRRLTTVCSPCLSGLFSLATSSRYFGDGWRMYSFSTACGKSSRLLSHGFSGRLARNREYRDAYDGPT